MNAHPHLFKRGHTYQWRRKTRRFSTGNIDIKLSLGTTDRHLAHILARKVSAESDLIMEQIVGSRITPEQGRTFLSEVIRIERAKITQLNMLNRIDSLDPEDDARHDAAMSEAWKRILTEGLNHTLPLETSDLVRDNIELIRQDMASTPRRNAVLRTFKEQTGQDKLSALENIQVMDLYVSGKAKAWSGDETAEVTVAPNEPSCSELPEPALNAIVTRMNVIKRVEGIEEKTLRQYLSFASLFSMLSGIDNITKIGQPDVKSFRADLAQMPKSWGKSPKDHALMRDEVMAKARSLSSDKVGLSVGTINRHLEHLTQIADWARDEGLSVDPNLKPSKLRKKETVRARDKRAAFAVEQLETVFKNPVWTGPKSEFHQTKPGQDIFKNGIYWCPLIGAYTRARREEIAGLAPSDIVEVEGIWCFSIEDSELRRIKNLSSRRMIPIHSHLIDLGFIDHVRQQEVITKTASSQSYMKQEITPMAAKLVAVCAKSLIKSLVPMAQNYHSIVYVTMFKTSWIIPELKTSLSEISSVTKARISTRRFGHQPSYVDGGRAELNRVVVELPLPAQITKRAKELRERTNPSRAMRADAAIATIGIITFGHAAQPIFEALKRERTRCNACKTSWSCVFSDTDFKFGRSAASAIASASF